MQKCQFILAFLVLRAGYAALQLQVPPGLAYEVFQLPILRLLSLLASGNIPRGIDPDATLPLLAICGNDTPLAEYGFREDKMPEIFIHSRSDNEQVERIGFVMRLDGSFANPFPDRDELPDFGRRNFCGTEEYGEIIETVTASAVFDALAFHPDCGMS